MTISYPWTNSGKDKITNKQIILWLSAVRDICARKLFYKQHFRLTNTPYVSPEVNVSSRYKNWTKHGRCFVDDKRFINTCVCLLW